jgi:hypothetical protein
MTTLELPSLERRFLQSVREEAESHPIAEWPSGSLELCHSLFQKMRADAAKIRGGIENLLAEGVDARAFAANFREAVQGMD